jgi:hypothetical protein
MFMRNDHEAQIKALRCELEDECRKLEEELHLQKSKVWNTYDKLITSQTVIFNIFFAIFSGRKAKGFAAVAMECDE